MDDNRLSTGRSLAPPKPETHGADRRLGIWYGILLVILVLFIARLFDLQIIKHDYYRQQALSNQLKEYAIPATRGQILAQEGSQIAPLVLNEKLYTLYADPVYIKDARLSATKLSAITGGNAADYEKAMHKEKTRYVVLAKKLNEAQMKRVASLKIAGVGTQAQDYRIYPQGTLASQMLGFVNDDGQGKYGLEQFMDSTLGGKPGQLKAITDVSGIPLAASRDNIQIDPKNGQDVVLTINLGMQKQLENILKAGLDHAGSNSGSAIIIDPNSGAIKAMANWPSYDPAKYTEVSDANLFNNAALSSPLEVGSIMKTLTISAALDLGLVTPETTFFDPSQWKLDGQTVHNVEEDGGPGQRNMQQLLNLSLNTGATWLVMQMGGGEINQKARDIWHDYLTNHYMLGKSTGIEQGYEADGYIPSPSSGYSLSLTYANTAFGQAMTATPLQMIAALSSVINGGTYYQPHLVDKTIDAGNVEHLNKPKIINGHVVAPKVGQELISLMEYVLVNHHPNPAFSGNYTVGGKTGTAEEANPAGGYFTNKFNGTFMGFVGGDKPQYAIITRVNSPTIGGYAGTSAAMPIFVNLTHMLIDNFNVTPKTGT